MIAEFFNQFLYRPLLNIIIVLCLFLPGQDFGLAIVVITVFFKALLLPLTKKTIESRDSLNKIKPKIEKIQKKFKDDEVKQVEEMKNLYKEYNINPFSSLVPMLIQLPILIALYRVFLNGFQKEELYSFVPFTEGINYSFFGINLTSPSIILAVLAIIVYFIQMKEGMAKNKTKEAMSGLQDKMPYFFSLFTFIILIKIPAAVSLYLATSSLFAIIQENILKKNGS